MAVELVRQVWCDIHLKKYKERVEAEESVATVIHEGRFIRVDACEKCKTNLTYMEILSFGYYVDQPKAERAKMGEKIRDKAPRQGGSRALVQCSYCEKQVTMGSGWGLHKNAHARRGEDGAEPIPVVA